MLDKDNVDIFDEVNRQFVEYSDTLFEWLSEPSVKNYIEVEAEEEIALRA